MEPFLSCFYFCSCFFAYAIATAPTHPSPSPFLQTLHSFPNNTWIENLAVRSNGKILLTLLNVPEPSRSQGRPERRGAGLSVPRCSGCAENCEDWGGFFAVSVNSSGSDGGVWSVWGLDLNENTKGDGGKGKVEGGKIADIPAADFLNGMAALPGSSGIVLVADSSAGKIYSLDTSAGVHNVAISGSFLNPNTSAALRLGVGGVQFRPGDPNHLYFDNSFKTPNFARIPINASTGAQAAPVQIIYNHATYPTNLGFAGDDFTFDISGRYAWLATNPSNSLIKVDVVTGQARVVVGGVESTRLVGPTACRFGRTAEDRAKGRSYITTNGALANPPAGGFEGGRLVALDTVGL